MSTQLFELFTTADFYGLKGVNKQILFEFSNEADGGIPVQWTGRIISLKWDEDNGAMHAVLWNEMKRLRVEDYRIQLKQLQHLLKILQTIDEGGGKDNNHNNNNNNNNHNNNNNNNNNINTIYKGNYFLMSMMFNKFLPTFIYPCIEHTWLMQEDCKELLQCYTVLLKSFVKIKPTIFN